MLTAIPAGMYVRAFHGGQAFVNNGLCGHGLYWPIVLYYSFCFANSARPALEAVSFPSALVISCAASRSLVMSTPVSMPSPCIMYTTSSVATLPVAPLAYGQPPGSDQCDAHRAWRIVHQSAVSVCGCVRYGMGPPTQAGNGAVNRGDANLETAVNVGERLAVGVVAVERELLDGRHARHLSQQVVDVACMR